jgi:hypothetical protein
MQRFLPLIVGALVLLSGLGLPRAWAGEPVFSLIFNANTIGNYRPCPS